MTDHLCWRLLAVWFSLLINKPFIFVYHYYVDTGATCQGKAGAEKRAKGGKDISRHYRLVRLLLASILHRSTGSSVLRRPLFRLTAARTERHQLAGLLQQPAQSRHLHRFQPRLPLGLPQDPLRQVPASTGYTPSTTTSAVLWASILHHCARHHHRLRCLVLHQSVCPANIVQDHHYHILFAFQIATQ